MASARTAPTPGPEPAARCAEDGPDAPAIHPLNGSQARAGTSAPARRAAASAFAKSASVNP